MVELKVNLIINNLNKIKKQFENMTMNTKTSSNKESKGSGAVAIGGAVAILTQLLASVKSVVGLLEVIGGMINYLVAPFVPILLGLIKPVFVVLQVLLGFMLKFFKDPKTALQDAFSGLLDFLKNLMGFGGEDKQQGAIKSGSVVAGAAIGGVVGGPAGALIGAAIGPVIADLAIKLGEQFGNLLITLTEFGMKLAKGFFSFVDWLDSFFGTSIFESIKSIFNGIVNVFGGIWKIIKGIFTLDWRMILDGIKQVFSGLGQILEGIFLYGFSLLKIVLSTVWMVLKNIFQWAWDGIKSVFSSAVDILTSIINGIIKLANKLPGIQFDLIGKGNAVASSNTQINVNIEGSADQKTVEQVVKELRNELNRRGAF